MFPGIEIAVAGVNDAEQLTALSVTTFCETFWDNNNPQDMAKYLTDEMSYQKLYEELADNDNLFFLASVENELAGYAKVRDCKVPAGLEQNKPMEIERIYVLKDYQGKKVGAALMQCCMDNASSRGYDIAWLGVWGENYKAIDFYKRWGFETFGSHVFMLGDDEQTDILMKKNLP
jgi:ribosomal protein S18 acetylase RimI-like enzyme